MLDLSILITCYNKEKYLSDCIDSVCRQSKEAKEIIVVHDGCDEPMAHAKADCIILKQNQGVAKARNEAFRFSTGALVLFVDGDDIISPDYLEKMTWVIGKRNADVAYPDLFLWSDLEPRLTITPKRLSPKFVKTFNRVVIPVTCLMKREVYIKVGGFRELPVLEDLDFWVRAMALDYTFKKAETLLWYRRYPNTRNTLDLAKRKQVLLRIMSQFDITDSKISFKGTESKGGG